MAPKTNMVRRLFAFNETKFGWNRQELWARVLRRMQNTSFYELARRKSAHWGHFAPIILDVGKRKSKREEKNTGGDQPTWIWVTSMLARMRFSSPPPILHMTTRSAGDNLSTRARTIVPGGMGSSLLDCSFETDSARDCLLADESVRDRFFKETAFGSSSTTGSFSLVFSRLRSFLRTVVTEAEFFKSAFSVLDLIVAETRRGILFRWGRGV